MRHELIEITVPGYEEKAKLYTYFLDNSPEMYPNRVRPVVVICPGGGYGFTSDREAEPIAMRFLAKGYHAVVLRYSVAPVEYPVALLQLASTVKYLKDNAEELFVDPDRIIVQGSSAGGHLAASFGVFWNRALIQETLQVPAGYLRPAGLMLSYPVITSGEMAHHDSFRNLLGDRYEAMKEEMSLETQVSVDTPPTFIWHTAPDDLVPVENSILFFQALHKCNIPVELHIYPVGGHGLGLADEETRGNNGNAVQKECQSWIDLACDWMKQFHNEEGFFRG